MVPFYQFQGITDYSQVSQPQKVHLKQSQFFDGSHGELGGRPLI